MSSEAVRRSNVRRTNEVLIADTTESSRFKERRKRRRRLREERNRRVALIVVASLLFFVAVLFLHLRPRRKRMGDDTMMRNERVKQLKNAVAKFGSKRKTKTHDLTNPLSKGGGTMRYLDPRQLAPLPGEPNEPYNAKRRGRGMQAFVGKGDDEWQSEAETRNENVGPSVDYTEHKYEYPDLIFEPPNDGSYPPLEQMSSIFETWGQDDLDNPPETLVEVLQHFDFQDPEQINAAVKYRDLELPFKVYNVPELTKANKKWTDEYVASNFNGGFDGMPQSMGSCSQSVDNFFAFHRPEIWDVKLLGPPPSLMLRWTFDKWARHAVYADAVGLAVSEKHYYWQSGVSKQERLQGKDEWTFVSRDLPSFSSPDPTFFGFNPPEQKGIQCRFGERGVTAATHYDGGRNMIAMITGAKRYILSPPNACPKLGIVSSKRHPSYRHSMLNFGRVTLLEKADPGVNMSDREKGWLKISGEAPTLSTVLKQGEVLYVPSHWFHYIVSLQKSAQCNTRSGVSICLTIHYFADQIEHSSTHFFCLYS